MATPRLMEVLNDADESCKEKIVLGVNLALRIAFHNDEFNRMELKVNDGGVYSLEKVVPEFTERVGNVVPEVDESSPSPPPSPPDSPYSPSRRKKNKKKRTLQPLIRTGKKMKDPAVRRDSGVVIEPVATDHAGQQSSGPNPQSSQAGVVTDVVTEPETSSRRRTRDSLAVARDHAGRRIQPSTVQTQPNSQPSEASAGPSTRRLTPSAARQPPPPTPPSAQPNPQPSAGPSTRRLTPSAAHQPPPPSAGQRIQPSTVQTQPNLQPSEASESSAAARQPPPPTPPSAHPNPQPSAGPSTRRLTRSAARQPPPPTPPSAGQCIQPSTVQTQPNLQPSEASESSAAARQPPPPTPSAQPNPQPSAGPSTRRLTRSAARQPPPPTPPSAGQSIQPSTVQTQPNPQPSAAARQPPPTLPSAGQHIQPSAVQTQSTVPNPQLSQASSSAARHAFEARDFVLQPEPSASASRVAVPNLHERASMLGAGNSLNKYTVSVKLPLLQEFDVDLFLNADYFETSFEMYNGELLRDLNDLLNQYCGFPSTYRQWYYVVAGFHLNQLKYIDVETFRSLANSKRLRFEAQNVEDYNVSMTYFLHSLTTDDCCRNAVRESIGLAFEISNSNWTLEQKTIESIEVCILKERI